MAAKKPRADDGGDHEPDPVERYAEIVEYAAAVGFSIASRWYERAKSKPKWSAEDVVGDCTDLVEHVTPLIERSLNLTIEALRPFAATLGKDPK